MPPNIIPHNISTHKTIMNPPVRVIISYPCLKEDNNRFNVNMMEKIVPAIKPLHLRVKDISKFSSVPGTNKEGMFSSFDIKTEVNTPTETKIIIPSNTKSAIPIGYNVLVKIQPKIIPKITEI